MTDPKSDKDLRIKTGVLKRYLKEVECYEKEAQKQADKINSFKLEPEQDQYVVKKANEVLQENQNMILLSVQNAKKAASELKSLLRSQNCTDEQGIAARELIEKADRLA